jgi:uncharacterized cupredoxin-like copper-binding protein
MPFGFRFRRVILLLMTPLLLIVPAACSSREVEVTRVVERGIIVEVTRLVEQLVQVTRVVTEEVEVEVEVPVEVEVTRIVQAIPEEEEASSSPTPLEPTTLIFEGLDTLTFAPDTAAAIAGTQVEVIFNNSGELEHTWALVRQDADPATVADDDAIAGAATGVVSSGGSKAISFTAPAAGTYQFMCTIPGHAAAGMVGMMTIN